MEAKELVNKKVKKQSSFRCALDEVPSGKLREAKDRLKDALGIKTDTGLMAKVNGIRETTISQSFIIESIFNDYGINVEWGCPKEIKV